MFSVTAPCTRLTPASIWTFLLPRQPSKLKKSRPYLLTKRRSMTRFSARSSALIVGLLSLLVGCGQPAYKLAPVSGTVTLDGEPLADGVVNFQPKGQTGKAAAPGSVGRTDSAGNYQLTTIYDEPGASPGFHKVKIYSYSPESAAASDVDTGPNQERVPERYNYRTKLTCEVSAEGTDQAGFELTTTPE